MEQTWGKVERPDVDLTCATFSWGGMRGVTSDAGTDGWAAAAAAARRFTSIWSSDWKESGGLNLDTGQHEKITGCDAAKNSLCRNK